MPELSVVVPTFNERDNLPTLLHHLDIALHAMDYEVIIVDDDSLDCTAEVARRLAQQDHRIRVLKRIGRRGLSSAIVEGMLASSAPYIAVLDADLQHDERILPQMLARLKQDRLDIVIGSRHVSGGSMGALHADRVALSNWGKRLSRFVTKATLSDPMSGFFVLDRRFLDDVVHSLSLTGYKILLDIIASCRRPVAFAEIGYTFRARLHGSSKLDLITGLEYLQLLLDKLFGRWIPVTYTLFGLVGLAGLLVYFFILYAAITHFNLPFASAQFLASSLDIVLKYFLNNQFTFRSHRLTGLRMLIGLLVFYLACTVGLWSNTTIAASLRIAGVPWYAAGLAGIIVGSVWNYWITSLLVWTVNRARANKRPQSVTANV